MMFSGKAAYGNTENGVEKLFDVMDQADTVLAGAGAELSTSAGFVYTCERLERYFGDFVKKYQNQ